MITKTNLAKIYQCLRPPPSPPFLKDETTNFPEYFSGSGSLHSLYISSGFLRTFSQLGH